MTAVEEFNKADALLTNGSYDEAAEIYIKLRDRSTELRAFCNYRLGAISNNTGDPLTAFELYYEAFTEKPDIALNLYGSEHSNYKYVFTGLKKEQELTSCPLCAGTEVSEKWCYVLPEAAWFNAQFNPLRLWMYCEPCHHVFARYFPEKLFLLNDSPRSPNPMFFSYYSNVLDRVSRFTTGMSLFEIGIGASECLLAAREIGFDTFGIDVIDKHVAMAKQKFGLSAETADFVEYQSDQKYDVIIMGDVIEHVSDPIKALHKAHTMLADDGALWVSTPNFDSAYSIAVGHDDAMKKQQYHLNYFSRHSFFTLLQNCGFVPVDYAISSHYNGSMEVIAIKA